MSQGRADRLGPALAHGGVGDRHVGDGRQQLGAIRDWFPTAEEFAWTDLLQTPVDSADLFRGVIQSLVYAAVFTALAFRSFSRRDVTS